MRGPASSEVITANYSAFTRAAACAAVIASSFPASASMATGNSGNGIIAFVANLIHTLEAFVFATVPVFGVDVEWIVIWMALPMVILTFYFGFLNLRSFGRAFRVLRGDYRDDKAPGEVTQFQALSTALSGTVGLGNIAGVALAIAIGGPGATLWMILIGLFAMTLKYAECTLAVKYRDVHSDGTVSGGPMYYLRSGLAANGRPGLGRGLSWAYAAVAVVATVPQITQANQAYSQLSGVIGINSEGFALGYGLVVAGLTAVVIIGGIRSIASVTARLVPLMTLIYLTAAITILLTHFADIPQAFATIFDGAFHPENYGKSAVGGAFGALVVGMRRAVYSTEAGLGTATIAHAAAKTREPVSEGMIALMEPFIDTVVICTMTALVIIITGAYNFTDSSGTLLGDVQMTSAAFGSAISWFPYVLAVAVSLFAFSTIISWGYYSSKVWGFVFGEGPRSMMIFKVIFCVILIPSGFFSAKTVYALVDSLYFLMAIPNIIGIYLLAPELKRDTADYLRRLKSGEIVPTVTSSSAPASASQEGQ